jgi:hypothetical protein
MASLADDRTAQWMRKHGLELTRENYIAVNWGNTPPDPWDAESEAQLPDELQQWPQDEQDGAEPPPRGQ